MKYLIVYFIIIFSSCFNIFTKEQTLLAKIDFNNHCRIEANLITIGATTEDVIQITSIRGSDSKILAIYQSYDFVKLSMLSGDSLMISLSDSLSPSKYVDIKYIIFSCN